MTGRVVVSAQRLTNVSTYEMDISQLDSGYYHIEFLPKGRQKKEIYTARWYKK